MLNVNDTAEELWRIRLLIDHPQVHDDGVAFQRNALADRWFTLLGSFSAMQTFALTHIVISAHFAFEQSVSFHELSLLTVDSF